MRLGPRRLFVLAMSPPRQAVGRGLAVVAILLSAGLATPAPLLPAATKHLAVTVDDLPIGGEDPGLPAVREVNLNLVLTLKREGIPAVGFVNASKL